MLQVGETAPAFRLSDADGNPQGLDPQQAPLTLAIFFKTTCPTCHYAWDYYERLYRAYSSAGLCVLGISQHDAARTADYRDQHNATFPHLVDSDFAVSRAFDPAFVPTVFLISRTGEIVQAFESWQKDALNDLSKRVAERLGTDARLIVTAQDNAASFKAG
jgi:peroxiredoxin